MQHLVFEDHRAVDLRPLTFTRPVWDLRCGILTLREKWQYALELEVPAQGRAVGHLAAKFNTHTPQGEDTLYINGKLLPGDNLVFALVNLAPDTALLAPNGDVLAFRTTDAAAIRANAYVLEDTLMADLQTETFEGDYSAIEFPWHLFKHAKAQIAWDFTQLTAGRRSQPIEDAGSLVYGADNVFVEEGANIKAAIIDAENGPIYIGKNATVQPGAIIQNSHAICAHATVNMGAKLRGDSVIGPWVKVGGEVGNSVFWGYSNKAHDGYLGNSVIGQWCNLGADTNTSNLKNNYGHVRAYNYAEEGLVDTGEMFVGLTMGDHSKCGINTMFNTGTVVGVAANIFGAGFPDKHLPSFAWGGANGYTTFRIDKAHALAETVMARRNVPYTDLDAEIMDTLFDATAPDRWWEAQDGGGLD